VTRSLLLLFAALTVGGCVTVAPYERENLAKPSMDMSRRVAESRFEAHVHNAREGASGGEAATGGGCGCN